MSFGLAITSPRLMPIRNVAACRRAELALSDGEIDMICATAPYVMAMTRRLRRARNFREEPANIYPIAIVTALPLAAAPGSAARSPSRWHARHPHARVGGNHDPGNRVRTRLPAGGRWIRTLGPAGCGELILEGWSDAERPEQSRRTSASELPRFSSICSARPAIPLSQWRIRV